MDGALDDLLPNSTMIVSQVQFLRNTGWFVHAKSVL